MLNQDKTELLILYARHRPQPPLESILVFSDVIYSSNSAKNVVSWFDTVMSMDKQINSICQSAFYHRCNIAQISKHISVRHSLRGRRKKGRGRGEGGGRKGKGKGAPALRAYVFA